MAGQSVTRKQGEGEALWMLGGLYEVVVSSEESGGAMTVMQITVPEGMGPPPHVHDSEELTHVLEGRGRYHIAGGETIEVGAGTTLFFPRGTEEWFEPLGGPVTVLNTYTGGIDRFFREFGEPAARREVPPAPTAPPDFERLSAIAEKHGLHVRQPVS